MRIGNDWDQALKEEWGKPYFHTLWSKVEEAYSKGAVYPPRERIFEALRRTALKDTKVVILGQDPYHGPGQAHGLAFSVERGMRIPPSLRNMHKELERDLGIAPPDHGSLEAWADAGVLLLNTVLTVEEGKPLSHKGLGWEILTGRILEVLSDQPVPMVFLLWGAAARERQSAIASHHGVFLAPHPSPLSASRGFFGARPFSRANAFLETAGRKPVDWRLP